MYSKPANIEILADPEKVAARVSDWLLGIFKMQVAIRIALAGGTTPVGIYRALAARMRDCEGMVEKITWYWTDERFRPVSPHLANSTVAVENLFNHLNVPVSSIHAIDHDGKSADHCARRYEQRLRAHHPGASLEDPRTLFTVVLLGLGADGHSAGLFPGTTAITETKRWVVATRAPEGDDRISLTIPVLSSTDYVGILITGAAKHDAFVKASALHSALPSARIRARREVRWFVDQEAFGEAALFDHSRVLTNY